MVSRARTYFRSRPIIVGIGTFFVFFLGLAGIFRTQANILHVGSLYDSLTDSGIAHADVPVTSSEGSVSTFSSSGGSGGSSGRGGSSASSDSPSHGGGPGCGCSSGSTGSACSGGSGSGGGGGGAGGCAAGCGCGCT